MGKVDISGVSEGERAEIVEAYLSGEYDEAISRGDERVVLLVGAVLDARYMEERDFEDWGAKRATAGTLDTFRDYTSSVWPLEEDELRDAYALLHERDPVRVVSILKGMIEDYDDYRRELFLEELIYALNLPEYWNGQVYVCPVCRAVDICPPKRVERRGGCLECQAYGDDFDEDSGRDLVYD